MVTALPFKADVIEIYYREVNMRHEGWFWKLVSGVTALLLSSVVSAVTVSPTTVNLLVGGSQTVTVSSVSGTLYVTNTNTSAVKVTKVSTTTTTTSYRLDGLLAGTGFVTFKDSTGSKAVTVTVTPTPSATLTGRLLASNCFQCHGTNGSGGFDRLIGKSESDLYSELSKYATGQEESTGIMAAHAMGYNDAQIRAIAKYFSTLR